MQQLTSSARPISEGRKLVEDLAGLLRIFRRGWRFIAVSLVICLTLAAIYVARIRPAHLATARLLVLHQGGRPLTVGGSSGDPFRGGRADDESLSTHLMIIRSPLIVKRASGVGQDKRAIGHLGPRRSVRQNSGRFREGDRDRFQVRVGCRGDQNRQCDRRELQPVSPRELSEKHEQGTHLDAQGSG